MDKRERAIERAQKNEAERRKNEMKVNAAEGRIKKQINKLKKGGDDEDVDSELASDEEEYDSEEEGSDDEEAEDGSEGYDEEGEDSDDEEESD